MQPIFEFKTQNDQSNFKISKLKKSVYKDNGLQTKSLSREIISVEQLENFFAEKTIKSIIEAIIEVNIIKFNCQH